MAIQPVLYRPIPAVKPVGRRPDEDGAPKVGERKRPRRGSTPQPGAGENLDTWV